ncbi:MAG: hypothetical protein OIF47_14415 [Marinibacterium sp.]|nr:hypothetical protein [Marinibacterium sp.]
MARKKSKSPKVKVSPNPKKEPRIVAEPPSFRGGVISWRFNAADQGGPFAWSLLSDGEEFKAVVKSLADIETMSETEQRQRGCHFIPTDRLSKDAQTRLSDIELDDLDSLYSIRLTGTCRVFCVHRPQYMRILWFDPHHKVCPAPLKHT